MTFPSVLTKVVQDKLPDIKNAIEKLLEKIQLKLEDVVRPLEDQGKSDLFGEVIAVRLNRNIFL